LADFNTADSDEQCPLDPVKKINYPVQRNPTQQKLNEAPDPSLHENSTYAEGTTTTARGAMQLANIVVYRTMGRPSLQRPGKEKNGKKRKGEKEDQELIVKSMDEEHVMMEMVIYILELELYNGHSD